MVHKNWHNKTIVSFVKHKSIIRAPQTRTCRVSDILVRLGDNRMLVNIALAMLRDNSWLFWIQNYALKAFRAKALSKNSKLVAKWKVTYLDLGLDVFNGIRCFNFQGDSLSSQSLDENLHTTTETKDQMKSWFLLNVIVGQCSTIFKLLSGKDQTLLVRWDSLLVLKHQC